MNFLFFSLDQCEYTICFAIFLRINYLFRYFIITSISISRFHYEFIIYFRNSLWVHYLFRDFTMYSQSASRISSIWIRYMFPEFTLDRLFSPNHFKFTMFFAFTPWIHFFPLNHYEFSIFFAISLWILYLISEITRHTLCFSRFNMNSLFDSRLHYKFTICLAILLVILHRFRDSLSVSQIHLESIFSQMTMIHYLLRISLWIHYLFREFTVCIAISLRILYLFREFTLNPLSFLRNHYEFVMK